MDHAWRFHKAQRRPDLTQFAEYLLHMAFVYHCTLLHSVNHPIAIVHGVSVALSGLGGAMPEHVDSIEDECHSEQDT